MERVRRGSFLAALENMLASADTLPLAGPPSPTTPGRYLGVKGSSGKWNIPSAVLTRPRQFKLAAAELLKDLAGSVFSLFFEPFLSLSRMLCYRRGGLQAVPCSIWMAC
jgi:hypothetical protein